MPITPIDYYTSVDEVKAALRLTNDLSDDMIDVAIGSASRRIDEYCNDQFWRSEPATARLFTAEYPNELWTGAFASTADLVVQVDNDDDGVFETTLPSSAWQATPFTPRPGRPYRKLEFFGAYRLPGAFRYSFGYGVPDYSYGLSYGSADVPAWPGRTRRARVRVTAYWGWPSVPAQVTQACVLMAIDHYRGKNMTNGVVGPPINAMGASGADSRYLSSSSGALNPVAAMLLSGLRDVVVA